MTTDEKPSYMVPALIGCGIFGVGLTIWALKAAEKQREERGPREMSGIERGFDRALTGVGRSVLKNI